MGNGSSLSPEQQETLKNGDGQDGRPVIIAIDDKLYDVTIFLNLHPGGKEVIMDVAGEDATNEFKEAFHSQAALNMMSQYEI